MYKQVLKGAHPGKTMRFVQIWMPCRFRKKLDSSLYIKMDGVMHACGHDGHTAILLGVAKALSAKTG